MPSVLTINVTNNSNDTQSFYFFQQPAVFTGGAMVYGASLDCEVLGPYEETGATLTFQPAAQAYACIQQARQAPQVGVLTGHSSASRAIDLAGSSDSASATTASFNPLGLSAPANDPGAQPGSFRMRIPVYNPQTQTYNVGSGVQTDGRVVLSSFVSAMPNYTFDCRPIRTFFVQRGDKPSGTVINTVNDSVDAARCDFAGGHSAMNVTLNRDGTWTVKAVR